jgi:hypothetical protein
MFSPSKASPVAKTKRGMNLCYLCNAERRWAGEGVNFFFVPVACQHLRGNTRDIVRVDKASRPISPRQVNRAVAAEVFGHPIPRNGRFLVVSVLALFAPVSPLRSRGSCDGSTHRKMARRTISVRASARREEPAC